MKPQELLPQRRFKTMAIKNIQAMEDKINELQLSLMSANDQISSLQKENTGLIRAIREKDQIIHNQDKIIESIPKVPEKGSPEEKNYTIITLPSKVRT